MADIYTGGVTGGWAISAGRYEGAPATSGLFADSLAALDIGANFLLRFDATLRSDGTGGVIFDRYAADDFKFAAISSATNQVLIGHYTAHHGWIVDASFDKTIHANKDYELTVTLKGTTVSVYLDGQALLGHVFNGVTVDGDFGLLSRDGTSRFDAVTIATNHPALALEPETVLAASAPASPVPADASVDAAALAAVVDAAIARWAASGLVSDADLAALDDLSFGIADLDGLILGSSSGNRILIDIDAAGFGWFVDATLGDDAEFDTVLADGTLLATDGEAGGRMDLLTVVMHEIGHVLGFDHDDGIGALMDDTLEAGSRALLPVSETADEPASTDESDAGPAPAGDSDQTRSATGDESPAPATPAADSSAGTADASTPAETEDALTADDTATAPAAATDDTTDTATDEAAAPTADEPDTAAEDTAGSDDAEAPEPDSSAAAETETAPDATSADATAEPEADGGNPAPPSGQGGRVRGAKA